MKKPKKTKEATKDQMLAWFEIPALNLERAISFYSAVLNISFETINTSSHSMAFFPKDSGVGGAIVFGDGCVPSSAGSLLYLNAGSNLEQTLKRVLEVGGQVVMDKTLLGDDVGHFSLILDTEGNRIALFTRD